ncbi:hypothetical protein [Bradyrhizobium sp. JYMT SZCCT0180]|uniref:hypothetical protein n=1 Tax=Bradyrhizobium sp. JYMT SZCCT0180 TaxID=2807666 RepID=UPI001BA686D4|nr:hypothetical protein [Bradyrhizobium sp. JYMT SZCCT0180]MBR1212073.1 hypothetical protein [Bradyrhizobium sp. JYMT SZCCT0180]
MGAFVFGQKWPDELARGGNTYWIGFDHTTSRIQRPGVFVLGKECTSIAEIEAIVSTLHRELDEALNQAREKLEPQPARQGEFQAQVGPQRSGRRR